MSEQDPHDVDIFAVPELPEPEDGETDTVHDCIPEDAEPVDYKPTDEDDTNEVS